MTKRFLFLGICGILLVIYACHTPSPTKLSPSYLNTKHHLDSISYQGFDFLIKKSKQKSIETCLANEQIDLGISDAAITTLSDTLLSRKIIKRPSIRTLNTLASQMKESTSGVYQLCINQSGEVVMSRFLPEVSSNFDAYVQDWAYLPFLYQYETDANSECLECGKLAFNIAF